MNGKKHPPKKKQPHDEELDKEYSSDSSFSDSDYNSDSDSDSDYDYEIEADTGISSSTSSFLDRLKTISSKAKSSSRTFTFSPDIIEGDDKSPENQEQEMMPIMPRADSAKTQPSLQSEKAEYNKLEEGVKEIINKFIAKNKNRANKGRSSHYDSSSIEQNLLDLIEYQKTGKVPKGYDEDERYELDQLIKNISHQSEHGIFDYDKVEGAVINFDDEVNLAQILPINAREPVINYADKMHKISKLDQQIEGIYGVNTNIASANIEKTTKDIIGLIKKRDELKEGLQDLSNQIIEVNGKKVTVKDLHEATKKFDREFEWQKNGEVLIDYDENSPKLTLQREESKSPARHQLDKTQDKFDNEVVRLSEKINKAMESGAGMGSDKVSKLNAKMMKAFSDRKQLEKRAMQEDPNYEQALKQNKEFDKRLVEAKNYKDEAGQAIKKAEQAKLSPAQKKHQEAYEKKHAQMHKKMFAKPFMAGKQRAQMIIAKEAAKEAQKKRAGKAIDAELRGKISTIVSSIKPTSKVNDKKTSSSMVSPKKKKQRLER